LKPSARPRRDFDVENTQTPCVKVCTYDPGTGLCRGCGRTLAEIAAWVSMSDCERESVMEKLPERLRRLSLPAN
jgi:predicted Fe-S protein YdhL (DUF1289 family)